jgi:deazaflavin-dependent oxidoreductase (nitroreductase family)
MSPIPSAEFNAQVIAEFRANGGHVGGRFESMPLLLLHHTGARTGQSRVNPVAYLRDGAHYVLIASKGGAPAHPAWYHNLKAHPRTKIEVGADTIDVVAIEATGDDRERLFRAQAERFPQFAEYEKQTARTLPVIVLTPAKAG